ncbi:MAG TPA: carboxypeptidase-like regulatory domain-containing protein [Candidatus Acidoferrales bacterium]|nr:carboxypeptidase-like regulatory domain-containing protein [Candidatus Acidoferrales bacterium]
MKIEKGESVNTFSSSRVARLGVWFALAVLALILMMAGPVRAQEGGGSISGSISDATGSLVPDVQITATNVDTKAQVNSKSDSAGLFRFSSLAIGNYDLEFTKQGFKKTVVGGVSVASGVDHGLGVIALQLGAVTVTVEVSAAPALIESSQSQISTTMTSQQITDYAGIQENQGLDFLALQLPGVAMTRDNNFSNTNGVGFSVDGIRGRNNDQEIDGQNNNDNSVAGPGLFLSNPDFVEQYQITTNNFAPEYGRNAGSVVNEVTPSGKNNWHGTIAGSEENQDLTTRTNIQKGQVVGGECVFGQCLGAVPWFNTVFASTTAGGPLVKDKFFVFGGFDTNISESNAVAQSGSFQPDPTGLAELATCYPNSDSVSALRNFGAFAIGAGNPTQVGTPGVFVTTVGANGTTPCNVEVSNIQRSLGTPFHGYDFINREDFVKGANRFYGRYIYNRSNSIDGNGDIPGGYFYSVPALSQDILLGWSRPITSNMTNEFRISYGRLNVEFGGNNFGNSVPPASNLGNALASISLTQANATFPATSCNPPPVPPAVCQQSITFDSVGPANNLPQARIVNTFQIQDQWSYVHGKHQWKAGVNATYQQSPNVFLPNFNGTYNFGTFTTPAGGFTSTNSAGNTICALPGNLQLDSLSAFACDIPASINITQGNTELGFKEYDTFLYVGDDYKLRPNLTINLGLTWTYFGQPANLFHQTTVAQQTGPNPFWDPALPLSVTTAPSIPAPKNLWGPGVGFAYTPRWGERWFGNDKTVIRGGYRLSYDPPFYNIYLNIATAAPQVLAQGLNNVGAVPNQAAGLPLLADPIGANVRDQLAPFLVAGVSDPRSFAQTRVTPHFTADGVHSWSFGIQRELGRGVVFEARYVGNYGFNQYQSINANPFIADTFAEFPNVIPAGDTPCPAASAVVPSATGRVNCNEGILRERTNTGYSHYNGLQLDLRSAQLFHQLTLHSSYTWSKTTDNASEIFSTFGAATSYAFSQNPLNFTTGENGLSGLDFPQSWTLSFVEALPFFRQQEGYLGHALGGWILTGNYILQSGQTYSPIQDFSSTFSGGVGQDTAFDNDFIGSFETSRPFLSNRAAPAGQVGIFAADACNLDGVGCGTLANPIPGNELISANAVNASGTVVPVTNKQVRFIVNGGEAQSIFGTPFGTAGRNSLRDFHTNSGNFSLIKRIKINERAHFDFRTDFINVFNHPNYASIDPFIEDAGLFSIGTGFANPKVTSGGNRTIAFAVKLVY